jgi:ribonuclease P/MRP protein subunit RPP40
MDFAKAFDKVSHWRLAIKLRNYGITGSVNKWIADFLTGRTQRVVCTGENSEWAPVQSGVPQGSVIGPILFLIYINDLPENISSIVRLFADDTIMYMTMTNETDAAALQADLDKLAVWEETWKMKFHPDKCSVLRLTRSKTPKIHDYKLHDHILQAEERTKYLGVTIDSKLCWNTHIDNITKKANSSLAFLRRNLQISQSHIKANAYTTLVRPQLEYAASVWDPYTKEKQKQLEMVQRRAARYVCRNYDQEANVTAMIDQLGWRSLQQRRADIRLAFFYRSIHGLIAVDFSHQLTPLTRASRHNHPMAFLIPSETRLYLQQSFLPRTIVQWNALPATIALSPSVDTFREGVCTIMH